MAGMLAAAKTSKLVANSRHAAESAMTKVAQEAWPDHFILLHGALHVSPSQTAS